MIHFLSTEIFQNESQFMCKKRSTLVPVQNYRLVSCQHVCMQKRVEWSSLCECSVKEVFLNASSCKYES